MEQIILDMIPGSYTPTAHVSQYDSGRHIRFVLKHIVLAGNETVTLKIRKTNGELVTKTIENHTSYVEYVSEKADCDVSGKANCEIVISKNDVVIGSKNFILSIEADPYDGEGVVVETASGQIATFETNMVDVLQEVKCEINATGGNGTPDNPIPINGYTEAHLTRCGVNLWDEQWEVGTINNNTGALVPNSSIIRSKNFIPVSGGATILIYGTSISNMWMRVFEYDKNENFIASGAKYTGSTYQLNANTAYLKFYMKSDYGTTYNNDISILYPSTLTPAYHPYNGQTYTTVFGQTVYGGVLDVTRGKLRVKWGSVDLGLPNYTYDSSNTRFLFFVDNIKHYEYLETPNFLCSIYQGASIGTFDNQVLNYAIRGNTANNAVFIRNTDYTDAATFKTAMSGVIFAYELATPFDIDLTPQQIEALLGVNNVWHDGNGNTEVKYLYNA